MTNTQDHRRRHSTRLPSWNYTTPGWYFITICTKSKMPFFGKIVGDGVRLTAIGRVIEEEWKRLPSVRSHVEIDEWVIMPNHVHGIIVLQSGGARASRRDAPTTPRLEAGSLGVVINHFESNCTKRIRSMGASDFAWQRGYYDHIIRNEENLARIRTYIRDNPTEWALDPYHTNHS